jgi:hypothetical protein
MMAQIMIPAHIPDEIDEADDFTLLDHSSAHQVQVESAARRYELHSDTLHSALYQEDSSSSLFDSFCNMDGPEIVESDQIILPSLTRGIPESFSAAVRAALQASAYVERGTDSIQSVMTPKGEQNPEETPESLSVARSKGKEKGPVAADSENCLSPEKAREI